MTIETTCSQCQRPLRLKPELAGKRIKCPQCKAVVVVPEPTVAPAPPATKPTTSVPTRQVLPSAVTKPSAPPPPVVPTPAKASAPTPAAPTPPVTPAPTPPVAVATPAAAAQTKGTSKPTGALWHLKTEDGEIFGPVPREELDEWALEGRVNIDCQLLLDGSDQWQWATDLYPELEEEPEPSGPTATPQKSRPATEVPKPVDSGGKGVDGKGSSATSAKAATSTPLATPSVSPAPAPAAMTPAPASVSVTPAAPPATSSAPAFVATPATKSSWRDEPPRAKASRTQDKDAYDHAPDETEETADDEDAEDVTSDRRWVTTFLLAFFLGALGIHRFYLGRVLSGVAMLFTCGGLFVWQIVDVVNIALERLPDHLGRPLRK